MAETKAQAERAFDDWLERYDDKYPKATACLARDRDELLAFYDFPAAHELLSNLVYGGLVMRRSCCRR